MIHGSMITILGLSGSLRQTSLNAMLLRNAAAFIQPDAQVEIGSIKGIPLYDGDVEASSGVPQAVENLKSRIARCDGLLLVTPEYNNSLPGVLKNAVDWLSRPPADVPKIFRDKPVALMGASPSGFGTVLAQQAWLPVLRTLGMQLWAGGRFMLSRANAAFDDAGMLKDQATRDQLAKYMEGYATFIRTHASPK
jgi:chromate reductase